MKRVFQVLAMLTVAALLLAQQPIKVTDGTTGVSVISGTAALKTDLSSVAGSATSVAGTGEQRVAIVGNVGTALDVAPGSAMPANAIAVGGSDGTNLQIPRMDPCSYLAWTYYVVNVTGNTQIATTAGSAKNYYICQMVILPTAAAANVNLVSSTTGGNACATSPAGMLGGATAALGASLTANGGFVLPASGRAWAVTAATNSAFCIFASAQVTGVIAYAGPV